LHAGKPTGIIEREAHNVFVSWLYPGVRLLGANMGRFCLYAAFATSRQCRVLAVEAQRTTFHMLVRNVELNSLCTSSPPAVAPSGIARTRCRSSRLATGAARRVRCGRA
jgi:hypothetical protein